MNDSSLYYDKIAHLYDIMYAQDAGFDYPAQVEWVDAWRKRLGLPKTVLDLACGTGMHLACFESLGYKCYGIDASPEMLKIAAGRLARTSLEQGVFHGFRLFERVPLITSFFNALNYNRTLDEMREAFGNIHANLIESGLLVFDIVCTSSPQSVFSVKEFAGRGLQFSRTFVGVPTPEGFRSTMYYVVFYLDSSEVIEATTMRGIYSVEAVEAALLDCEFTVLHVGSGYSQDASVFVAQKPKP